MMTHIGQLLHPELPHGNALVAAYVLVQFGVRHRPLEFWGGSMQGHRMEVNFLPNVDGDGESFRQ